MLLTYLRPARPDDCETIQVVHTFSVRYACEHYYDNTVLNAWLARINKDAYLKAMNEKILWVAEYKGNIQGFFQLDLEEGDLDALYVHPFVHRHGLGTAMLQRAEYIAYQSGLGLLKLYASLNSVMFYELNGYERLGACELMLNPQISVKGELMRKYLNSETVIEA